MQGFKVNTSSNRACQQHVLYLASCTEDTTQHHVCGHLARIHTLNQTLRKHQTQIKRHATEYVASTYQKCQVIKDIRECHRL